MNEHLWFYFKLMKFYGIEFDTMEIELSMESEDILDYYEF